MKQMSREEFGARLAPALSLYLSASADRARAEAEIRTLLPYRGDDLLKSLSSPPYLCDECDAPVAFAGFDKQTLCGGCSAKRKAAEHEQQVEAQVQERLRAAKGGAA